MLSPLVHVSSMYGPVPIGFSSRSPVPPVFWKYSLGSIPNEEKATLAWKAGSGVHIVKRTVSLSTAAISLIRPAYFWPAYWASQAVTLATARPSFSVMPPIGGPAGAAAAAVGSAAAGAAV